MWQASYFREWQLPKPSSATIAVALRRTGAYCGLLAVLALPMISRAGGQDPFRETYVALDRLPPSWHDDRGDTLRLQSLSGQRVFLTMAYTSCHRICPMTMARLAELQRDLDARGISAEFLIVSYDPANDDSAAWRRYRARYGLLRENWHFLSGSAADTQRLARELGFEYWRDGDHVMHDFRIVALGSDGAEKGVIDSAHRDWQDLL
jgi:cytochrome oxidase Cu insertion factor (SCO1/SenC/PrrC family)